MARTVRLLTTNDFFASFAPVPTSYGALPGGNGLRRAVEKLREGQPTIWADVGDMFNSGPLSQLTDGVGGFAAASELGIDLATVGNHDLDYGVDLFKAHAAKLSYPLICANQTRLGLPHTRIVPTSAGDIGFIGLTHPLSETMWYCSSAPERELPAPDRSLTESVAAAAKELRASGASAVIAILHDGVAEAGHLDGERPAVDPARFAQAIAPWQREVDVILAGHTLHHFMGELGGTPVVQPFSLGSEIGVFDLDLSGERPSGKAYGVLVEPAGRWDGPGSDVLDAAGENILGTLAEPLFDRCFGPSHLADFVAEAMLDATDADFACAYSICGQAPLGGYSAWWGAGPVSRLQLLQAFPWSNGRVAYAEIDAGEHARLMEQLQPTRYGSTHNLGIAQRSGASRSIISVAVPAAGFAARINSILGRELDWREQEASFAKIVGEALRRRETSA